LLGSAATNAGDRSVSERHLVALMMRSSISLIGRSSVIAFPTSCSIIDEIPNLDANAALKQIRTLNAEESRQNIVLFPKLLHSRNPGVGKDGTNSAIKYLHHHIASWFSAYRIALRSPNRRKSPFETSFSALYRYV
jgi:hypothetical protein